MSIKELTSLQTSSPTDDVDLRVVTSSDLGDGIVANSSAMTGLKSQLVDAYRWLKIFENSFGHEPYCIEAYRGSVLVGFLPLSFIRTPLFGRFLVSLPYLNSAGVVTDNPEVATLLAERAAALADALNVRYLELRQEREIVTSRLAVSNTAKVIMRLPLPATPDELWKAFRSKLRSQIKSGQKQCFVVEWGTLHCLDEFYAVFARNMRDLGTPVYSKKLFSNILKQFPEQAEFCIVRHDSRPIGAALVLHKPEGTEIPSASTLREFNSLNPNMAMYWQLLCRAIERGQSMFDFGRSTVGSGTYRFKEQWGAVPHNSVWQYYLRRGRASDMRPQNSKFRLAIRVWQQLPLSIANFIGPTIVRGIP